MIHWRTVRNLVDAIVERRGCSREEAENILLYEAQELVYKIKAEHLARTSPRVVDAEPAPDTERTVA
jgi:hypothetical protein